MEETTNTPKAHHRHENGERIDVYDRSDIVRRGFLKTALLSGIAGSPLMSAGGTEEHGCITDVGGLRVGHFTDTRGPTGCTVVIFDRAAAAGVDVRGSAPGTRETDLLNPINTVQQVNAILLTGGSAFGLDAATGVMRYLEEQGLGFHMGSIIVPIVPAAVLYDLHVGDHKIRPDAQSGYAACKAASSSHVPEGNVGAGAGATVGTLFGFAGAMKGGIGTASIKVGNSGLVVAAIVAVNAVGDVIERRSGQILAGARIPNTNRLLNSMEHIASGATIAAQAGAHSTIGIVATNADLNKTQMTKVAQMAHDGFARTINPTHTAYDGDTIFAAATATSKVRADASTVGAIGAEAMARAVNRAVITATGIPGYPAHRDIVRG